MRQVKAEQAHQKHDKVVASRDGRDLWIADGAVTHWEEPGCLVELCVRVTEGCRVLSQGV